MLHCDSWGQTLGYNGTKKQSKVAGPDAQEGLPNAPAVPEWGRRVVPWRVVHATVMGRPMKRFLKRLGDALVERSDFE